MTLIGILKLVCLVCFLSGHLPYLCVDLQAQARAHRIGQKKPVQVYRLVCLFVLVLIRSFGVLSPFCFLGIDGEN